MLKSDDELLAFGEKRAEAGQTDLSRYLVKLGMRGRHGRVEDGCRNRKGQHVAKVENRNSHEVRKRRVTMCLSWWGLVSTSVGSALQEQYGLERFLLPDVSSNTCWSE